MEFENIDSKYSLRDVARNIKLPKKMTPELAEVLGIILGDGHLGYKKYKSSFTRNVSFHGSYLDDFDYYELEIKKLLKELFNIEPVPKLYRKNELYVGIGSKSIAEFIKNLGVPIGNKVENNKIPKFILESNKEIKRSFLRGIFDTDGSITFKKYKGYHSKPVINLPMKSEIFIFQLVELLNELGIDVVHYWEKYYYPKRDKLYSRRRLYINGKKKLAKFLDLIGFRNPKHLTKVRIYQKFGFCPPNLPYKKRLDILGGRLDPYSFYDKQTISGD